MVQIFQTGTTDQVYTGKILGLTHDGGLKVETESGEEHCLRSGIILAPGASSDEFQLRPVDSQPK
jgi:hypothetical protein